MLSMPIPRIRHIYISPGHNYFGHHGRAPSEHPMLEVAEAECVPGSGLAGDRFFGFKSDYKGQVTFFAWEVFQELCAGLGTYDRAPSVLRRNIVTESVELGTLIGQDFELQGIRFHGTQECAPCHWMDKAFAAGAEKALRGKGGLRAQILSEGWLRVEEGARE